MRFGEGGDTRETIAGAVLLVGLVALFSVPAVLGSWRRYMARSLLDTLVAGRPTCATSTARRTRTRRPWPWAAPACDLGAFDAAGLVEPFTSAGIDHVLQGEAEGIPFVLAELRLYNAEGFEVFAGVVGGFRLQRACPGLTLVTRERGLLGNLIASAGTGIERVGLEDPDFERRFEVYGTDQVGAGRSSPPPCWSGWSGSTPSPMPAAFAAPSPATTCCWPFPACAGGRRCGASCFRWNAGSGPIARGFPS